MLSEDQAILDRHYRPVEVNGQRVVPLATADGTKWRVEGHGVAFDDRLEAVTQAKRTAPIPR